MLEFILLSSAWFTVGYVGTRLLARKGYSMDGINAIREDMFVDRSVKEINPHAQANMVASSIGVLSVGGLITLVIAIMIRPKERHLPL